MKCVEVYKELYHQEPFAVAFCPYRIVLWAHMLTTSMEKSTVWQSTGESTWPITRRRMALWNYSL